jgi:hypothetical protein
VAGYDATRRGAYANTRGPVHGRAATNDRTECPRENTELADEAESILDLIGEVQARPLTAGEARAVANLMAALEHLLGEVGDDR